MQKTTMTMEASNQIVPYYDPPAVVASSYSSSSDDDQVNHDAPPADAGIVGIMYNNKNHESILLAPKEEATVEQMDRLKRWRKKKTLVAGLGLGVVLLVCLGPVGGGIVVSVAGGLTGALATKKILKRREKKVIDRLVAMQYPLVYNPKAVFA